jgi:hypothetical protein
MEYRLRKANGEYGWILDLGNPRYDSEGQFAGYIGYCYDITEKKLAEEKMSEQMNELQRWHNVMLDREDRVIELKGEVNELLVQAGKPLRYPNINNGKDGYNHLDAVKDNKIYNREAPPHG